MTRCRYLVTWVDCDWVTLRCVLPPHSDGLHSDGVAWFDDLGYRVPGGRHMERAAQ